MKIYLSSTYRDLREHRFAVDRALRRMGHDVIGMEQYVAEGAKPLDRCLSDVQIADVYLLILAWRYGHVVAGQQLSITELEFLEAKRLGKPVLAFLLDPEAPWPPGLVDAMSSDSTAGANVSRFRGLVGAEYLAGMFTSPESLASQAAAAVARQSLGQSMVERLLAQDAVNATDMGSFGIGTELNPSSLDTIVDMVHRAGNVKALIVDLGDGDEWWSTRLYLLASLLHDLTSVRQLVFKSRGRFGGMASPAALLDGLGAVFTNLADFRRKVTQTPPPGLPLAVASKDTQREVTRQTSLWQESFVSAAAPPEPHVKVGVRSELLKQWLGERLIDRCLQIDESGPTLSQVQQIVDSLLLDLPIERRTRSSTGHPDTAIELQVVCRDAFALALAREWVRSSLPRLPTQ